MGILNAILDDFRQLWMRYCQARLIVMFGYSEGFPVDRCILVDFPLPELYALKCYTLFSIRLWLVCKLLLFVANTFAKVILFLIPPYGKLPLFLPQRFQPWYLG